jgi:GNAT superfamily N-acetyltransferase
MDSEPEYLSIDAHDAILRVWRTSGLPIKPDGRESRAMMAAEMSRDFCQYLGLSVGGLLVAVTIVQYDGRHGWINRLAVDPQYQRRGLAGRLIEAAQDWLGRYGDDIVVSGLIEQDNLPSQKCFARHGFRHHETITYWSKRPRPNL